MPRPNKCEEIDVFYALLATQNALLRVIVPELSAVFVDLDKSKKIFYIYFYYNGEVPEDIIELWRCAITEASASLGPDYFTDDVIQKINYPKKIPFQGKCAYLRKESSNLADIKKYQEDFESPYSEGKYFSAKLRCVMQNVLLGAITSNIRGIGVNWWGNIIFTHFYYHGEISEKDKKIMHEIMNKLFDYFTNFYIYLRYYRMDEPIIMPEHQEMIFLRYEKEYEDKPLFSPKRK